MKKLLVLMLACLLLTGCGKEPVQEVPESTPEASGQQVPEAVGLYAPDSWAEIASCGAVRAYPLGDGNYVDIRAVGRRILVVNDASITSLLQGAEGEILATQSCCLGYDKSILSACLQHGIPHQTKHIMVVYRRRIASNISEFITAAHAVRDTTHHTLDLLGHGIPNSRI